jgi:hypothetical protein
LADPPSAVVGWDAVPAAGAFALASGDADPTEDTADATASVTGTTDLADATDFATVDTGDVVPSALGAVGLAVADEGCPDCAGAGVADDAV